MHATTVSEAARVRAEDPELAARVARGDVSLHRAIRELRRGANGDLVMARQRPVGIEEALRREEALALVARRHVRAWMEARADPIIEQRRALAATGAKSPVLGS